MRLTIFIPALSSLASVCALSGGRPARTIKDAQGYPAVTDTSVGQTSNVSWACVWNYQTWFDALHIRGVNWDIDEKTLREAVSKGGAITGWQFIAWVSRGEWECGNDTVWIEPGDEVFHADVSFAMLPLLPSPTF